MRINVNSKLVKQGMILEIKKKKGKEIMKNKYKE
jgi:hypothetical protein